MFKKLAFFAALLCGFFVAAAPQVQYGAIGNMTGSWRKYFGTVKHYSGLAIPENLDCKVLFISSLGQKKNVLSEKEYDTLLDFCRNGGILVTDGASISRFNSGRRFMLRSEVLGGSYYSYGNHNTKAVALGKEIFGADKIKTLTGIKFRGAALGRPTSIKPLLLSGKSVALGVNRIGKGVCLYVALTVNNKKYAPAYALVKDLVVKLQDEAFLEKYFPAAAANNAVQINGKKHHLIIAGSKTAGASKFLEKKLIAITGKKNFVSGSVPGMIKIYVGITPEVEKLNLDFKTLHHYGYYMIKKGDMIILAGKNTRANYYAVNDFLKRFAGYRNFGDHPITEVIPSKEFLVLPKEFSFREEPDIPSYYTPWTGNGHFGRNGRSIATSTHSMNKFLPPKMYADKHPEWYSFINGKRVSFKGKKKPHWQPCLNNPELGKLALAYADRYFKTNPHSLTLPFGVNDGAGDCRCDYCMALDAKYGNRYAVLYNIAAKAIRKKYPDKFIGFIAYGSIARNVPRNMRMEDNIIVEVCNIGMVNSYVDYAKWKAVGIKHFALYDYFYTFGGRHVVPRYFPHYMINIWNKEFKKFPVKAIWLEYYPKTRIFELPRQYVFDEYVWNTKVDVEALLTDYFQSMYGPGAKEVRAYFDYLEKVFCRRKYYTIWPDESSVEQMRVYQMADLIALDKLLAKAAPKFAKKDIYAKRFDLLCKAWSLSRLYIEADICVRNIQQGKNIIANANRGYELGDLISNFKFSPADEKLIFTRKTTIKSMRHRLSRLHPLAHLDKAVDRKLDALTAQMLKNKSKKAVAKYYRDIAKTAKSEQFRRTVLTQVWQLEHESKNIVRNGGFESGKKIALSESDKERSSDWFGFKGLPGWFTWRFPDSEMEAIRTSKYAHSGKYCAGVAGNQVKGGICATIRLEANCRYRFSVYVMRNDDNRGRGLGSIGMRMKSKGKWLDYGTAISARASKACIGKWEKLEVTFSAPKIDAAGLLIFTPPQQGKNSLFLIDDVSVVKIFDPKDFK